MAGRGSRFADAGYPKSKPLLEIHGVPMFQVVLANLITNDVSSVIIVAQESWGLSPLISDLSQRVDSHIELIEINHITSGPAETVLLSAPLIDHSKPLVVANSDQFVDFSMEHFYGRLTDPGVSGAVLTMEDSDPKWSYVRLDESGFIVETREKKVISEFATVGIYGFSKAGIAFEAIQQMIEAKALENGEYYVGPSFNYLSRDLGKVVNISLGPIGEKMHGLGIPKDFETFLQSAIAKDAANAALNMFQPGRR
jgi:NDP-sugar pyrophosphorylase family protein